MIKKEFLLKVKFWWIVPAICILTALGCRQVALYERLGNIPGGEWHVADTLTFPFEITDTTVSYNVMVTVRHTQKYPYRNLWVKAGLRLPGEDTVRLQDFDLPLANAEGWLGTGMNDVFERRIRLFKQPVKFDRAGVATFSLQHIMRQNQLPAVLQVGIRIEPAP